MAKLVKRNRRRVRFEGYCVFILLAMSLVWLASCVFVGNINNSLTMEIQNMQSEIAVLKSDNKDLNIDIQTLQNKDRIYVLAQSAGLAQNQDNIISISGE